MSIILMFKIETVLIFKSKNCLTFVQRNVIETITYYNKYYIIIT